MDDTTSEEPRLAELRVLFDNAEWTSAIRNALADRIETDSFHISEYRESHPTPLLNLVSCSGIDPQGRKNALQILESAEQSGATTINGSKGFRTGTDRALQLQVLSEVGCTVPQWTTTSAPLDFPFPALWKPTLGGSGKGIERIPTAGDAAKWLERDGILQEDLQSDDSYLYRVEVLGGKVLYAIRTAIDGSGFNYCPGHGCSIDGRPREPLQIDVDSDIEALSVAAIDASGLEFGSVEYLLVNSEPHFIDLNHYSNYRTSGLSIDPVSMFVERVFRIISQE